MTDGHQGGSGYWDSYNVKTCRIFWVSTAKRFLRFKLKLHFQKPWKWWRILHLASPGIVLNENTEIKYSLHFQLHAIPLEPT